MLTVFPVPSAMNECGCLRVDSDNRLHAQPLSFVNTCSVPEKGFQHVQALHSAPPRPGHEISFHTAMRCRATGEEVDLQEVCRGSSLALKAAQKREVSPEFRKECDSAQLLTCSSIQATAAAGGDCVARLVRVNAP